MIARRGKEIMVHQKYPQKAQSSFNRAKFCKDGNSDISGFPNLDK